MMDEERRSVPPAPGASALLVIFAVLCLTVLAMLSLSTVQQMPGYRMPQRRQWRGTMQRIIKRRKFLPSCGREQFLRASGRSGRILL